MSESKKFNEYWSIWYHSNSVKEWTINDYHKLHTIYNEKDFWNFFNNLPPLTNGMFFIMRKDIAPIWEVEENRHGGAWTIHVSPKRVGEYFMKLTAEMICDELVSSLHGSISGISLTPKYQSFSLKIWNNDYKVVDQVHFVSKLLVDDGLNYKRHLN